VKLWARVRCLVFLTHSVEDPVVSKLFRHGRRSARRAVMLRVRSGRVGSGRDGTGRVGTGWVGKLTGWAGSRARPIDGQSILTGSETASNSHDI